MSEGLIYKKMAAVMADIKGVPKDGYNQAQRFSFRSIDDTVNIVKHAMDKHGVTLVPTVDHVERWTYETSKGSTMNAVNVMVSYTFFAEDGSCVMASMTGEASDSGDKATSKALSMALKYLFFQTFLCGTDPDPDAEAAPPAAVVVNPGALTAADKTRIAALGKKAGFEKDALRSAIADIVGRQISSTADLVRDDLPSIERHLTALVSLQAEAATQ
jgi:ERF superfamily